MDFSASATGKEATAKKSSVGLGGGAFNYKSHEQKRKDAADSARASQFSVWDDEDEDVNEDAFADEPEEDWDASPVVSKTPVKEEEVKPKRRSAAQQADDAKRENFKNRFKAREGVQGAARLDTGRELAKGSFDSSGKYQGTGPGDIFAAPPSAGADAGASRAKDKGGGGGHGGRQSQLNSAIRRAAETNNTEAALGLLSELCELIFEEGFAMEPSCANMLMQLATRQGYYDFIPDVVDAMHKSKRSLDVSDLVKAFSVLNSSASAAMYRTLMETMLSDDMLALMPLSEDGRRYVKRFLRLLLLEHLTEAEQCLSQVFTSSPGSGGRSLGMLYLMPPGYGAAGGGRGRGGGGGNQNKNVITLSCVNSLYGQERGKRALGRGDTVLLSPMNPHHFPRFRGIEAELTSVDPSHQDHRKLDVKLKLKADLVANLRQYEPQESAGPGAFPGQGGGGGGSRGLTDWHYSISWRMDKLGNRVSYERALNACKKLATRQGHGGGGGGGKGGGKGGGGGGPQGPNLSVELREALQIASDCRVVNGMPPPATAESDKAHRRLAGLCAEPVLHNVKSRGGSSMRDAQRREMESLNASQRHAIGAAMHRRLTLIQGPPGTGKTRVSCALIANWVRNGVTPTPILACADSNVAVDNLARGLDRLGINVVRLGRMDSVHREIHHITLDPMAPGQMRGGDKSVKNQLARADVVCCTCTGSGSDTIAKIQFAAVVVDEAAQVTQLNTLVALTRGCKQLVLVGDHHQLPPTVLSEEARARPHPPARPRPRGAGRFAMKTGWHACCELAGARRRAAALAERRRSRRLTKPACRSRCSVSWPTPACAPCFWTSSTARTRTLPCSRPPPSTPGACTRPRGWRRPSTARACRASTGRTRARRSRSSLSRRGKSSRTAPRAAIPPRPTPCARLSRWAAHAARARARLCVCQPMATGRPRPRPCAQRPLTKSSSACVAIVCAQTILREGHGREGGLEPRDIGVITPYQAQVNEIQRRLGTARDWSDLEVATVDGYQGALPRSAVPACPACGASPRHPTPRRGTYVWHRDANGTLRCTASTLMTPQSRACCPAATPPQAARRSSSS